MLVDDYKEIILKHYGSFDNFIKECVQGYVYILEHISQYSDEELKEMEEICRYQISVKIPRLQQDPEHLLNQIILEQNNRGN